MSPRGRSPDPGQLDLFGPVEAPAPAEPAVAETAAESTDTAPPRPPVDHEARLRAQTEFVRPLLIEAGAGTGKTTTLTARIVAWALGPGWDLAAERLAEEEVSTARPREERPSEAQARRQEEGRIAARTLRGVAAITFTEAAAAEMASRVGETFARLAAGDPPAWLLPETEGMRLPPAERRARARALLGSLDQLTATTIHAFCRGLLTDHPLEARLHPELQVDADGSRVEALAREVVEERLPTAYGDPGDPHWLALAGEGIGPQELTRALEELVQAGAPASLLETDPLAGAGEALAAELRDRAQALDQALGGCLVGAKHLAGQLRDALEQTLVGQAPTELSALTRHLDELWPENLRKRLREWGKGKSQGGERETLGERLPAIAPAAAALARALDAAGRLDPERLDHARRALGPLLATLRERLRALGVATFQDLLTEAHDLVREHPAVATRVRRRLDQLLVDEFQDTDALQARIVARLALSGPEEERPGLFLVGDPKQSIYGWRGADLAAYDGFRDRLREAGGEVLPLVENFRSVPAILDEVARTIAPVMVEEAGLQPRFEALRACAGRAEEPGFVAAPWQPVEVWVPSPRPQGDPEAELPEKLSSGEATRLEAEAVAADLARLHREGGVPFREVALLLRAFSDLDLYLEALRRRDIPFAVVGDRQYYRRREVIDAVSLVRAVLDPGDHVALVAWLRSPVVGVPDAALLPLWNRGFPRAMTELSGPDPEALGALRRTIREAAEVVSGLALRIPGLGELAGWEASLRLAIEHLAILRRAWREEPGDRFVETLRTLFPFEPLAAARYLGRYRLANLERFFRRLERAIEETEGSVDGLLRALRRGVAEAQEEAEGRPSGDLDAVQVMTVHKAKGLDFGHVYLAQMHKTGGGPPSRLATEVAAPVDGKPAYRLLGAPTPSFHRAELRGDEVEANERVRLLYVAMTRPKDRLVLTGNWRPGSSSRSPETDPRQLVAAADCFQHLLAPRFPHLDRAAVLEELWQEAGRRDDGEGRIDRHGVRWLFTGLTPDAADPATPEGPERTALPDLTQVALEAEHLRRLERAAGRRMARPVSAAASEEAHHQLREHLAERFGDGDGLAGMDLEPGPGEVPGEVSDAAGDVAEGPAEGASGTSRSAGSRAIAMAAGTAVHRILELYESEEAPEEAPEEALEERAGEAEEDGAWEALRARLDAHLPPVTPADRPAVLERVDALLDRFEAGPLFAPWRRLMAHAVARELPVLLPPEAAAEPASSHDDDSRPVGHVAGSIDLLARDPETGRLVVIDYKTDAVLDDGDLEARAAAYGTQGRLYARAVTEALGLPEGEAPRVELWFLEAGRVVVV